MKKLKTINVLALIVGVFALPATANAASLLEIYQQALQSDPQIHEAEARRLAALEAKPQARSAYLPQLSLSGDYSMTERTGPAFFQPDPPDGDRVQADGEWEADTMDWGLTLRQTIFSWDTIVNLKRADKQVARAEAVREAAQQDLVIRVAQRYFDVLAAEDRLTSVHANRTAIARRLEQAKQRFEVGLIAITDVQESQAAYDQAVADEISAKRSLATSREYLREITGEYVTSLSAPKEDFPLQRPQRSERDWVDTSLSQNLNLVASRLDEKLARDEISFRRNGHYPTLELTARVNDSERDSTQTFDYIDPETFEPRSVSYSDTVPEKSDGLYLSFNLPLFAGGGTTSRVREAVYLHRASREQLQRVTRETERQSRDAYLGVLAEESRVRALEQAVSSSRTALEATQAGFDVGTRTIVDVLNSQFSLYLAITNYYQSRYDYILNVLRLKQAAGTLQVQDLEEIDQFLIDRKTPEEAMAEEEAAESGS